MPVADLFTHDGSVLGEVPAIGRTCVEKEGVLLVTLTPDALLSFQALAIVKPDIKELSTIDPWQHATITLGQGSKDLSCLTRGYMLSHLMRLHSGWPVLEIRSMAQAMKDL